MDPRLRSLYARTAVRVAVAEEMPAGPALFVTLEALATAPMDATTAVRLHALWGKMISHCQARQMMARNDTVHGLRDQLLQPESVDEAEMLAAQELACAAHVPYATARNEIALVARVADCLPQSWEALDRGEITLSHLKAVERVTRGCRPRLAEAVDHQVVPLAVARGWTASETSRAARRILLTLDPDGAAERADTAKAHADVTYYPEPDEVATLVATGDATLARRVFSRINDTAEAMSRAGDDRPVGVRRFHALADAVLGDPQQANPRVCGEVIAHVDLTTLLCLNEKPGELVGYGPISAASARRIATDHRLRRLVTDPLTGAVADLGRRAYAPSTRLREAVRAIHPTCGMPGCLRPAIQCEIDHRSEHSRGGRTDQCNLKPLCKLHHQMKTKKRWKVDVNPDGSETWTSHLGFTYTRKPEAALPTIEPADLHDEPAPDINDRLPESLDPDPPHPDQPLPEPPPLTDEEYLAFDRALDTLHAFGHTYDQWLERHYDEARAIGLVA
jgi:hypothetical protein